MKKQFSPDHTAQEVRGLVSDLALVTVCESALCPNVRECYSQRQLTFMILGDRCTRSCAFCAVAHGKTEAVAADEPWRVAEAISRLALKHAVITSVARDDLADEGAGHFVETLRVVRQRNPGCTIEVLVPDFHGRRALIQRVIEEGRPEVFAHNVETVRRLSGLLRPQADYRRSLDVLRLAALHSRGSIIKSSVMVGLGETRGELAEAFGDLLQAGVTHLTIGQYLRPDAQHLPVMEYISPERFQEHDQSAREAGFAWVKSGPFVRSSYHAIDALTHEASDAIGGFSTHVR